MEPIGERLKEERQRLGYSQTDFAQIGGVAKSSQIRYESGERSPDNAYWTAIAGVGADIKYILLGERTPTERDSQFFRKWMALPEQERTLLEAVIRAYAESRNASKD